MIWTLNIGFERGDVTCAEDPSCEGGVDAAATKTVITTHPLAGALLSTIQPPAPPAPIALGPGSRA